MASISRGRNMKYCKYCGKDKPCNLTAKRYSKAYGFQGARCWDCVLLNTGTLSKTIRATSVGHAKANANSAKWRKANLGIAAAAQVRYRTSKLQRIVPWTEHDAIKALYIEASTKSLAVDHIVPLRGKNVSGLHVLANLQLLTHSENSRKSNNY